MPIYRNRYTLLILNFAPYDAAKSVDLSLYPTNFYLTKHFTPVLSSFFPRMHANQLT